MDINQIIKMSRQNPAAARALLNKKENVNTKTLAKSDRVFTEKQLDEIVSALVSKEIGKIPTPKDGKTPSKQELRRIILPLIPNVKDGKNAEITEEYVEQVATRVLKHSKVKTNLTEAVKEALVEAKIDIEEIPAFKALKDRIEKLADNQKWIKNAGSSYTDTDVRRVIEADGGLGGLPDQTGNSGKFLTTDGSDASWATLAGAGDMTKAVYDTDDDGVVDEAAAVEGVGAAGNSKYYGTNGAGAAGFYDLPAGGSISDGDKGDITVSGSGATWTIDDEAVTFAKMQHIATNRILGRSTAGTGDVESLTSGQVRDIAGVDTDDSPQFAGINVGHATDTTITRVSAGVIAVEGTQVARHGDNLSEFVNDAGFITAETDDQTAAEVPFTPAGNIAATDVQAALEELDSEKGTGTLNNIVEDTTPQLGGDLDAQANDITDVNRMIVGNATGITTANDNDVQHLGTDNAGSSITLGRFSNTTASGHIDFVKSRNASIGGNTIVNDNDILGELRWYPADGADFATQAAIMHVEVDDASPAAGDIGTAFVWKNMPGGGGALTERMRLAADGTLTIGGNAVLDAGDKTGLDAGVVSGTAGTAGNLVEWDGNGDAIDSGIDATNVISSTDTATTSAVGVVELATDAEVTTGTDTTRAVTPAGAKVELDKKLALTGGTMTGDINLGTATSDTSSIILNSSALADEKWSGTTITGTAGATLAIGDLVWLDPADSEWKLTDGILDGTDSAFKSMVGICVDASTDGNPTEILLNGTIASAAFPAFTVSAPVYMSDTAGDMVVTQPSTTNFAIRIMGYALSTTVLHFNPSPDYIVHA